jgi:hypothetical protein
VNQTPKREKRFLYQSFGIAITNPLVGSSDFYGLQARRNCIENTQQFLNSQKFKTFIANIIFLTPV